MGRIGEDETVTNQTGWIGFDLDGTLAKYDGWQGVDHIGEPVPLMVQRIRDYIEKGVVCKIFTARVCTHQDDYTIKQIEDIIKDWCEKHIGYRIAVTNQKDFGMIKLYDDRCQRVEENTGILL
jgi:translation initiation factor 2 alpha subunit (eIF-2alpha)